MFRSLFPFRRLLATTFLVVFVNVFVGQCWCATVNPAKQAMAAGPAHCATDAPAKPAHVGCHGHGPAKADHHQASQKQVTHQPATKHDCCKDKSASLLASLIAPTEKCHFDSAPAVLPTSVAYHFRPQAGSWNRRSAVALVPPRQLKPKIPDIRIFIQSLTV